MKCRLPGEGGRQGGRGEGGLSGYLIPREEENGQNDQLNIHKIRVVMKDTANDVLPASNGELQTDHEMPFHEIYNRRPLYVTNVIVFHIIKLRLK